MIKCSKCGSENIFISKSGNNTGAYCSDCGKWITWLSKDQLRLAERQIDELKEKENKLIEDKGTYIPCRVGDEVYVCTGCGKVRTTNIDGVDTCPFEDGCGEFYCHNSEESREELRVFKTSIEKIVIDNKGTHIILKDFKSDFSVQDFGRVLFYKDDEALQADKDKIREFIRSV